MLHLSVFLGNLLLLIPDFPLDCRITVGGKIFQFFFFFFLKHVPILSPPKPKGGVIPVLALV